MLVQTVLSVIVQSSIVLSCRMFWTSICILTFHCFPSLQLQISVQGRHYTEHITFSILCDFFFFFFQIYEQLSICWVIAAAFHYEVLLTSPCADPSRKGQRLCSAWLQCFSSEDFKGPGACSSSVRYYRSPPRPPLGHCLWETGSAIVWMVLSLCK